MRTLLVAIVLGLTVLCAILAWRIVDRSVTLDHTQTELDHKVDTLNMMKNLVLDLREAEGRAETLALLRSRYPQQVKEDGSLILVRDIGLRFEEDELVELVLLEDR